MSDSNKQLRRDNPPKLKMWWEKPSPRNDDCTWTLATLTLPNAIDYAWIEATEGGWRVMYPKNRADSPTVHPTWKEAAADAEADLLAHAKAIVEALG